MSLLLLGVGRGVVAAAAAGAFTPTSDPTATHWWDASDTATHTGSGDTLSIADKIGSAALGTSASNGPSGTETINGLNAFTYDGSERQFTGGIADLSSDTFHLFLVCKIGIPDNGGDSIVSVGLAASNTDQLSIARGTGGTGSVFIGRVSAVGIGATSADFTVPGTDLVGPLRLIEVVADVGAGTISAFVNGTSALTPRTGYTGFTTTTPRIQFFASGDGANKIPGTLCEAVVCNAPRTSTDLTAMRGYLNTKWGL